MVHNKIFLALLGASGAHSEKARKIYEKLDLTEGQPKILYLLRLHDGIIQKNLAEKCSIRQSTLTVLIAKMEIKGLVRKENCYVSGNKRAYRIFLTDIGKYKSEILEIELNKLEDKAFEGFSPEERQKMLQSLARIEKNLRDHSDIQ